MVNRKYHFMSFEEAIDVAILARKTNDNLLINNVNKYIYDESSSDKLKEWINSGTMTYEIAVEVLRGFQECILNKHVMELCSEYIDFLKLYLLCNAPGETYKTWCEDTFVEIEPIASNSQGKPYSL